MDEEEFDATRETCMLLGGKLMDIRAKQHRTYSDNQDLEVVINRDIMAIRFEDQDFAKMDVEEVRASTPLRKRSPTPLDRLRSREPSPFCMPKLRLGSGTITPGGVKPADPHTFFSRSSSSQSLHQGGGGLSTQLDFDSFRAAMEAKQAEDESLPTTTNTQVYSHSMRNLSFKPPTQSLAKNESNDQLDHHLRGTTHPITKNESSDQLAADGVFLLERPSSAMSEMSIHIGDHDIPSRAESRMEAAPLGDAISQGHLNIHSNMSSRRGSEFQNFMTKENKNVSSWLNKNDDNDDNEDRDLKTPMNQLDFSGQASDWKSQSKTKEHQTTSANKDSEVYPPEEILRVPEKLESKAGKQSDNKQPIKEEQKQPSRPQSKQSNEKKKIEEKPTSKTSVEREDSSNSLKNKKSVAKNINEGIETQPKIESSIQQEQGQTEDPKLSRPGSKIREGQSESITDQKKASRPGSKQDIKKETELKTLRPSVDDVDTVQEKKQSRPGSRMKEDQGKSLTLEEPSSQTDKQEEMSEEETARPSSKKQMSRPGSKMKEEKGEALNTGEVELLGNASSAKKQMSRPGSKLKEEKSEALDIDEVERIETASPAKKQISRPGSKMKTEVSEEETVRPASKTQMLRPGSKMEEEKSEVVDIDEVERLGTASPAKKQISRPGSKMKEEMSEEETARPSSKKQMSRPGSKMKEDDDIVQEKKLSRPGSKMKEEKSAALYTEDVKRMETASPAKKQISRPGSKMQDDDDVIQEKKLSRPGSKMKEEKSDALYTEEVEKIETASPSKKQISRPGSKMKDDDDVIQEKKLSRPGSKMKEEKSEALDVKEVERPETASPARKKQMSRPGSNMKEDDEGLLSTRKDVKSPVATEQQNTDAQGETEASDYSRPKSKSNSRPGSSLKQKETETQFESSSYETDSVTELQGQQVSQSESRPTSRQRKETKTPEDKNQSSISRPNSKLRKKSETEGEDHVVENKMSTLNRPKSRSRKQSENEEEEELKKLKDQFYKTRLGNETENKEETLIQESDNVSSVSRPSSKAKVESASRPMSRNEELRKMAEELVSEELEVKNDIPKRGRTISVSSAGFEQTEPAEWIQDEEDEDELMIILNTDTYGLGNVREEVEEEVQETSKVDDRAMEELEIQYQLESGKRSAMSERSGSRPLSPHERPPSILKGGREGSNERKEKEHHSRPGSRSSNKDTSMDRKKISFDDDYQPNVSTMGGDDVDHSQERPGSRTSIGSHKSDHNIDRKKSSSLVPELETVEVPRELKEKLDRIENSDVRGRPLERRDSPRPPSRPSSTGYTHLDEFERKLAEMEDDLQDKDDMGHPESPMQKSKNMWNLVDDEIMKERSTYDGYYLNKEAELPTVDHSMIMDGELEEELRSKKVSFASKDEKYEIQRQGEVKTLGKNLYSLSPPKPMRKLPGKEGETEEYQPDEEEKIIQSKEVSVEKETSKGFFRSLSGTFKRSRSHTPDTEKENTSLFGSLLRRGKWGSRSASRQSSVDRESQDVGSDIEGRISRASDAGSTDSLVMKIKKLGKKKQKKVSTTDFDELFARGRAMSAMNDSEPELVKSNEKSFRNVQDDDIIGFNEKVHAFLEDQAKNSEYIPPKMKKSRSTKSVEKNITKSQSFAEAKEKKISFTNESNLKLENKLVETKKPDETNLVQEPESLRKVSTYSKPEDIKLAPTKLKKDIFTGKDLPQTQDEEFLATITDFVSNYKQKPNYEQIWPASPSRPNRSKSKRQSSEILSKETVSNLQDTQINLQNVENNEQQNLKKGSSIDASLLELTADPGAVSAQEMEFLTKVSSFVNLHGDSEDYVQKIWPSTPATDNKKKKTMSPGKSYLEHTGESQWFGTSIEADSYEAQKQVTDLEKRKKSKNSLSAGASLMRHHLSTTASTSNPSSEPMSPSSRPSARVSNSQPPPELHSSSLRRSGSNQSQISNQEFYTKLVIGLQKYTTPEPESRKDQASIQFPNQLQKSQSDTHVKDPSTKLKAKSASTTLDNKNKISSDNVDKNLEFYDKLVTGLKVMTSNQELAKDTDPYKKYSHHLGRAEFGTLKRKDSVESNKSKLNYSHSFNKDNRGRDSSFDKINPKLKKMSRQDSGEKYVRGQSRMSDTSETMPDLEIDDEIETEMHRKIHGGSEG